jgi:hypothetical protein
MDYRTIVNPLGSGWELYIPPNTITGIVFSSTQAICFDNPSLR